MSLSGIFTLPEVSLSPWNQIRILFKSLIFGKCAVSVFLIIVSAVDCRIATLRRIANSLAIAHVSYMQLCWPRLHAAYRPPAGFT